jgi:hypothetical protein
MEEDAPERGAQRLSGPLSTATIEPNRPELARGSGALLAWAVQRHAEGLFALLLCQGRGAMHERQLLWLGGTHGQRAPVLQPRFSGADRGPPVIFSTPFGPQLRAL